MSYEPVVMALDDHGDQAAVTRDAMQDCFGNRSRVVSLCCYSTRKWEIPSSSESTWAKGGNSKNMSNHCVDCVLMFIDIDRMAYIFYSVFY